MSARQFDTNGWFEIKGNPLSKVGIFDYSGAQIGAPPDQAGRVFRVFRPEEELSDADAVASFRLAPIIDDHEMLGGTHTPAEQKGVHGVIGEDVSFKDGVLSGNIKVFSSTLAEKIKNGKTELSCGYRCRYDFTPGTWNGQPYDVVQRTLRGNHLALVDEGRMGPEISVLDHLVFTVDAKEKPPVVDNAKLIEALQALINMIQEGTAPAGDPPTAPPAPVKDEEPAPEAAPPAGDPPKVETEDGDEDKPEVATEDSKLKAQVAKLQGELAALKSAPVAMDEKSLVAALAQKADLASRLSLHVGTFDHASMTVADVATYGVTKLGIKCPKGQETTALDAYLLAKTVPTPVATGQDAKSSSLAKLITDYAGA